MSRADMLADLHFQDKREDRADKTTEITMHIKGHLDSIIVEEVIDRLYLCLPYGVSSERVEIVFTYQPEEWYG